MMPIWACDFLKSVLHIGSFFVKQKIVQQLQATQFPLTSD